ncbi:MAG TPA: SDR family oxidoreductase [Candidatus Omnitrophota bacterium]|nr:SDR family oxidoreductase [Candidatus Omnitrophota bacterium]HRZ15311.1 SDR family oxidoreductase [Candidatus Omnitrophota bacterium]
MNILITGGAGFLGSHLCRRLLAEKHRVICVDNFITGSEHNIKDLLNKKKFTLIRHDITKPLYLDQKLDWVMHFASPASPVDYRKHPIKTIKVGTLGTHTCLGIAMAKHARFFLASTSEVYGDPAISPQPEEYWGHVNPIGERSCYDEAKRAAEAMAFAYKREHGVDVHVVRIFNTFGPCMRFNDGRVVSNFIYQALTNQPLTVYGKGSYTRSFCYVDDLVEGIVRFMKADYPGPLNLGTTYEFTVLELAKKIIALTGSRSKIEYLPAQADDPRQRRPDLTKARKLLRWQPRVSFEQGLKKTISWFKKEIDSRTIRTIPVA